MTKKRVLLIGVGGASCSGKTILAKHLRNILPGATIIHQDDFVPEISQVPYSKQYPDLQDWDDPPTCIIWPDFIKALQHVKTTGTLPPHHSSHDHLNKQVEIEVDPRVESSWKARFVELSERAKREKGEEIVWFIVDGFVLYWHPEVVDLLDVRLFLRVDHDTLKRRREERQVYVLQHPDDTTAGGVWTDPPDYFTQIVYPAYLKAHSHIFANEDVETGSLLPEWASSRKDGGKELIVITPEEGSVGTTKGVEMGCGAIWEGVEEGVGSLIQQQ